jgi:hypothetical protein
MGVSDPEAHDKGRRHTMTTTKKLETFTEVRDFVFMQLDHAYIRPGAESRMDEETWVLAMASQDPSDGLWIVEVRHQGDGTFVCLVGFRYFDDPDEAHWVSLNQTNPLHGSNVLKAVTEVEMMVHACIIEQPSRVLYEGITNGTVSEDGTSAPQYPEVSPYL